MLIKLLFAGQLSDFLMVKFRFITGYIQIRVAFLQMQFQIKQLLLFFNRMG